MATQTTLARISAHKVPVPAPRSMSGAITNTDDAGVATDSVSNRTPTTPSRRVKPFGTSAAGGWSGIGVSGPPPGPWG